MCNSSLVSNNKTVKNNNKIVFKKFLNSSSCRKDYSNNRWRVDYWKEFRNSRYLSSLWIWMSSSKINNNSNNSSSSFSSSLLLTRISMDSFNNKTSNNRIFMKVWERHLLLNLKKKWRKRQGDSENLCLPLLHLILLYLYFLSLSLPLYLLIWYLWPLIRQLLFTKSLNLNITNNLLHLLVPILK